MKERRVSGRTRKVASTISAALASSKNRSQAALARLDALENDNAAPETVEPLDEDEASFDDDEDQVFLFSYKDGCSNLVVITVHNKSKAEEFQADEDSAFAGVDEKWRNNSFWEREACTIKKSKTERPSKRSSDRIRCSKIDLDAAQVTDSHNYRIFVATWNVAGNSPPSYLNLEDWLHTSPPADICSWVSGDSPSECWQCTRN